jgi:CHASE2 domain-containing sensor protein
VHLPWLVIDVCGIVACILIALRSRQRDKYLFFSIILTIPASYYISYLIAITASDFRFMYPSTLVMQVITLTCMFSVAAEKIRLRKQGLIGKHRSEAPGHSYESVSE